MRDKDMGKPKLVVLTPVLNEAWILPAFLKATSLWADNIIIADQMSTDGSRELYKQFPKVIVVDNPRKEMHQAQTRRLLFEAARKIEGDKILFALDADEFISGNFPQTESWKTIMNSKPGDTFCFKWMNLSSDGKKYLLAPDDHYYWAVHANESVFDGTYPDDFIHEWRLPWPKQEGTTFKIDDIRFIHFLNTNIVRTYNKRLFYSVSQFIHPSNKRGGIAFGRFYRTNGCVHTLYDVPQDAYAYYEAHGLDIWKEINFKDVGQHYIQVVLDKINGPEIKKLRKLDIWNEDVLRQNGIKDPRRPIDKLMHWYLRKTCRVSKSFVVRGIDFLLKRLY